ICMEGPAFSSRAESLLYRQLGAEIIGMTALPEAKLAREAELAYAMLALVTDYDCWKHRDADVEIGEILEVLRQNVALARDIAAKAVLRLSMTSPSSLAADALAAAIVTAPDKIPADLKQSLSPIIGRYIKQSL
ncbi:MAG TPA: S-methyl-5'-thioadenosine phosphorylase, partial [Oligoflexia bacterium]|nr:S-methyl-5'-thioadenosine phosphorylase [Oligoflexia bacterium]